MWENLLVIKYKKEGNRNSYVAQESAARSGN